MGTRFVHLGHDITHVELGRFLARREVLERCHETTHDLLDGCHRKGTAFNPPTVILVQIGIHPLKRIAARVVWWMQVAVGAATCSLITCLTGGFSHFRQNVLDIKLVRFLPWRKLFKCGKRFGHDCLRRD